MMNSYRNPCQTIRHGFTVVEMLVVVGIIALLAGITAAVYVATAGSTQEGTSKSILTKLQVSLDSQWKTVTTLAYKETIPGPPLLANLQFPPPTFLPLTIWPTVLTPYQQVNDQKRANWVMLRQQQAFPRTFGEVLQPINRGPRAQTYMLPPLEAYQRYFADLGMNTVTTNQGAVSINTGASPGLKPQGADATFNVNYAAVALESSVCLLMALQHCPSAAGFTQDQLGKPNIKNFSVTVGAGGNAKSVSLPALVDGWGNPLWFTYQQKQESGQWALTPVLLSAGPNFSFDSTVTVPPTTHLGQTGLFQSGPPATFNSGSGTLNPGLYNVALVTPAVASSSGKPKAYDLISK